MKLKIFSESGPHDSTLTLKSLNHRSDLELKNHKLAEVMADYGDVVPRRDFEKMEAQFATFKVLFLGKSISFQPGVANEILGNCL